MALTTVSTKYQIVIPKEIRENMKIHPGQKMIMIQIGRRIEMTIMEPIENALGIFPHLDTSNYRDEEDGDL